MAEALQNTFKSHDDPRAMATEGFYEGSFRGGGGEDGRLKGRCNQICSVPPASGRRAKGSRRVRQETRSVRIGQAGGD